MEEGSSDSDDPDYHNVFAAVDDLRLGSETSRNLKIFFKENWLRDETLFLMQSEAELKEILVKELKLPFGHGFSFSRLWFKRYHNKNDEEASCEGLPKTNVSKNDEPSNEPSKQSNKQENEPSQIKTPSNGGLARYRREGNQNHTDSTKREMKICLEEHDVKEMEATATPMTPPGGTGVQSEKANALHESDDVAHVSITELTQIEKNVGLKESSSTEEHEIYSSSSSSFEKRPSVSKTKISIGNNDEAPKEELIQNNPPSQVSVTVNLPEHEINGLGTSQDVYLGGDNAGHGTVTEPGMSAQTPPTHSLTQTFSSELEQAEDNLDNVTMSLQNHVKEDNGLKGDTFVENQTATGNGSSSLVSMTLSPPGKTVEVGKVENDIVEAARSPQMHDQSVFTTLHQDEVVCRDKEGLSTEPPMATENECSERCERANNLDATADLESLQIRDQNYIKNGNASMEISSTGTQTVTSSGQSVSDKQGYWTSSVLIDDDVQKMSPKDENVLSEVKEVISVCEVYNNNGDSNHEKGARAVCSEETDASAEQRAADETLKENELQSKKMTSNRKISISKGRNTEQRKASNGASKTQASSKAKDSEGPQNADESTCLEGETLSRPERAADDDMSEARTPHEIQEHSVSRNITCVKFVTTGVKVASEKEIEDDCLGGTVKEEPSKLKTNPDQEPSFLVKNKGALVKEGKTATRQEVAGATNLAKGSMEVNICTPRPHGEAGGDIMYEKGSVLDAEENRELEFKSCVSAQPCSLPWKIMEKAKKFICGCLNADRKGIIYFGVGDNQEQDSKYKHGEILGLKVEDNKDDVTKAFQSVLDDHIKSDAGPLQKGGEQNCVSIHFIPVMRQGNRTHLYVIEIEVFRDWRFCKDNVYYSKTWSAKRGVQDCDGKKKLSDFFKAEKDEYDDVAVRTNGATSCVKQLEVYRQVKKPLEVRYKEWRRQVSNHGTLHIAIKMNSVKFGNVQSRNPLTQEEARRLVMKEMTKCFLETHAAEVPANNYPLCLDYYLKGALDLTITQAVEGSLRITVECRTLNILERLWEDYCSGHLNAVAEERLLTEDIKKRFDVESVKLETTILEKDYLACKMFLMDISNIYIPAFKTRDKKEGESLLQDRNDQAADETQAQTVEEAEPMTVHFAVNYMGDVTNTDTEGEESQQQLSKEETNDVTINELPQYFQHLKLIHDLTPTEGNEDSLRLAVRFNCLEELERLWEDYRSGRLNEIAEKYLVTDEIKRRFHVESVNLATTILEEDYLACKEFLSSKPNNNAISPIEATGETSAQTSVETQTNITVKRVTLDEIRIQPAEECQNQMVDETEIFDSENIRSPSAKETRTLTVESMETQVTAEAQVPLTEETSMKAVEATESGATGVSKILSVKKTQIQATIERLNLGKDETLVQPPEETCNRTEITEFKYNLDTEDADTEFPETYVAENTEEGQASMTIINTPGKPDEVTTVENGSGEAAILPQIREQSVHQLYQAEVVCLEQDGAGKGKAIEPPVATKIEYDVQCEIANESDATGGLHMYHQNHVHVKEINAVEENSSTGDQTATSSVGDGQAARPRTGSVLIEGGVREMSSKNESVSSEVTESVPIAVEDGAFAGIDVKEGETETLKGNESQSTNTIPVPKAKRKKKKQKKGSKGATATDAKDTEGPQNVDEHTRSEGQASITLTRQGEVDVDINNARTPPEMSEHSVTPNANHAEVVTTDPDIPLTPKMASEKKVEDCLGGSTQEDPAKTEPSHEPSSLVKSERIPVEEVQTVIQKEAEAANLNKGSTKAKICSPRPRGVAGRDIIYEKGSVFDAEENRELEFASLVSALPCSLPWKIMEKAKKFICGCLNAGRKGTIYFGVGDNQEQDSKYRHGEILGLEIEDIKDDINKAFQFVLDDHIKSDAGPLRRGGEQNCVSLHFVPVKCQGNLKNLYVVEIEVSRDWRFCEENIYYSKTWTEKCVGKDCAGKKALSDFFKVKDEYDDVAVRTNGATSSVKQIEVDRQVKKPLEVKYKEWRKQFSKHGAHELPEEVSFDDADAKRLSLLLRERLRELNHKEYGYILIANKLPAKYRGTVNLSFLQNIPWLAVFDLFDPGSKKDGLHYACNETTDAPRATFRTLDDFKDFSTDKDLSIRETTWILGNEEMQTGDWIKCSKDCLYRALSAYKQCYLPGHLVCVFLCLSETSVHEMADIMESSFSILGTSANSCVTIISEAKNVANAFIKASKFSLQRDLHECTITDISWSLLKEIVREMMGPSNFEERGKAIKLPYFNGGLKEVLNKIVNSWNDLEVYSPNPRLPSFAEHIEKERNAFYKGSQASQVNLFHNHSIPRSLEKEIHNKVERALKYLSKESGDVRCQVKTITFPYEPGSGATTLCRRILWNKRMDYRCAVVKAITSSTDFQIERLQSIGYDERNLNFSLPVLILVDNFPENDVRQLTERIMKRETKCVVLTTFPIGKSATNLSFEITALRKLDENETRLVKDILINITSDVGRRKEAEQVLEREKRFIWFGLQLFGRDYLKIEEKLQNHIQSILSAFLGDSRRIHKKVLEMCCFLSKYSDGCAILPHAVLLEFIQHTHFLTQRQSSAVQDVHEIFGGLLLEEQDETNGYFGWRPAHYLVSEVVTSGLSTEDTAVHFLEKVCKCQPYVVKFLRRQVFKMFLDRKRISDPIFPEEQGSDDNPDGSDFDDVFGSYEVRTRYSPLIVDILNKGNIAGALRVLIAICGEAKKPEDKAYAWQQLARFMGYEMLENEMNESEDLHKSLFRAMAASKGQADSFQAPKSGIEAAHIAVDIAINHHPHYGHHYVTKGDLYRLQLRQLEERHYSPGSLHEVIEICRKALDVYDKALKTSHGFNHYPMIGKIQAILSLLKFVKNLPCFDPEDEIFTKFLEMEQIPFEMEDFLSQDEHDYVKSLSSTTLDVLNELFENVKFKQTTTYDENEIRSLTSAKIRASKLRRAFYKITGYDRRQLNGVESQLVLSPSTQEEPAHYQHVVEGILFIHDETPYSTWSSIPDRDVESIYNHLKPVCIRGHGSHNDMLICCKACLQLKERPPVSELDEIVTKWVVNFPNSVWAHLFNYMVHFPIPNRSLAPYNSSTKASIKKCVSIVTEKAGTGFRKSGTEYFLGKGIGLDAILSSQEFRWLENRWRTKTHFWRSKETTEKLERVQGQKDVNFKGVITYQGIRLNFDNTLYPNESKDDLWFYIGFSVAGPYAYDPVDNDTYAQIRQQAEDNASTTATNPSCGVSVSASKVASAPGHVSRSKPRMSVSVSKQFALPTTNTKPPDVSQTARRPSSETWVSRAPSAGLSNSYCDELSNFGAPRQSTTGRFLYSSALQDCTGSAKPAVPMAPKPQPNWKTVTGTRGSEKKTFPPKLLDTDGKLHHGAFVLGLRKSKECPYHNPECKLPKTDTNLCNFAHGWRGDTKQIVCTKCTDKNLYFCKEKVAHEEFFWDLGPYFNATGTVWKGSRD